ncbi:hypothetical protein QCA50_018886 [Cerrena zonata]|uniref:Uncharacterized protein n=1 Tax=Cerrena zonata TaxID=2478898 RepID=A0AAW0FKE6_9APHY
MNNFFSSQETLVNLSADEIEWYHTLNPSPQANNTELVNGIENALTLHQCILHRTRAIKHSTKHQLQSAKHGLIKVVRQVVGWSQVIAN